MALIKSPTENPNAGVAISNVVLGLSHPVEVAISLAQATAVEAIMPWAAQQNEEVDDVKPPRAEYME